MFPTIDDIESSKIIDIDIGGKKIKANELLSALLLWIEETSKLGPSSAEKRRSSYYEMLERIGTDDFGFDYVANRIIKYSNLSRDFAGDIIRVCCVRAGLDVP